MGNKDQKAKRGNRWPGIRWIAVPFLFVGIFMVIGLTSLYAKDEGKPVSPDAEAKTYVGMEICATCHEKETREFHLSPHARTVLNTDDESVVQGCETCHGPGSTHVEQGGGRGTMPKLSQNPKACFSCHSEKELQFKLPYRHPVMEGKMSCSNCHNSHGSDKGSWTTTSLDGVNGVCFNCHKEQRGPFVYEHEALREGCTNCHDVHGSINDKMLVVRDSNLCFRCHSQADMAQPTIGDSGHSSRLPEGTCFSAGCHTAVHGSNFNDHLRY